MEEVLRFILFIVLCCLPLGIFAEEGFLIESIEIAGARPASESVLRASLMLEEGKRYNEEELRQASYRLESLLFVVRATLQLQKGSERGAYRLRINVNESRRWFYALQMQGYIYDEEGYQPYADLNFDPESGANITGLTFGRRWFPGKNGVLTVFGPSAPGVSYTHYNLFNRNVIAGVAFQYPGRFGKNYSSYPENDRIVWVEEEGLDSFGLTFSLGKQVGTYHHFNFNYKLNSGTILSTLRAGFTGADLLEHEGTNYRNHKTEFVWRYDRKDHPLFPIDGEFLKAGLFLDREFRDAANDDPLVPYDKIISDHWAIYLSGEKYWEQPGDRTLSLGFVARTGYTDLQVKDPDPSFVPANDYSSSRFSINVLAGRNIWEKRILFKERDIRLEAELSYDWARTDLPEFTLPGPDRDGYRIRLDAVSRDNFGLLRFSLQYSQVYTGYWQ